MPLLVEQRLPNGLRVITLPMPWLHEAEIALVARAGSRFEAPQEAGLAHFLEHMLFKGTGAMPDPTRFHRCLDALAADVNGATSPEQALYWISLPPAHLEAGGRLFAALFTDPAFSDLETERCVVLEEMREDENDRGELVQPALMSAPLLWPGHALARSVLGTPATLARLDTDALRRHLARHYGAVNLALAFTGPVTPERTLPLAQAMLGSLPPGTRHFLPPPPPMTPGPHWLAADDTTSQLDLVLFFRTDDWGGLTYHPGAACRRLLDDGLASRLQVAIREQRGLAYEVWAAFSPYADTALLEIGATVSP
ncbi:MAG: insulinase family protein, partial [Magnetococcales bacterium]|nr:insulinase family protein [Magnetococcales bacterium]